MDLFSGLVLCLEGALARLVDNSDRETFSDWCLFWFMTEPRCCPGWPQTPKLSDNCLRLPDSTVHESPCLTVSCYFLSTSFFLFNKKGSLAMLPCLVWNPWA